MTAAVFTSARCKRLSNSLSSLDFCFAKDYYCLKTCKYITVALHVGFCIVGVELLCAVLLLLQRTIELALRL